MRLVLFTGTKCPGEVGMVRELVSVQLGGQCSSDVFLSPMFPVTAVTGGGGSTKQWGIYFPVSADS